MDRKKRKENEDYRQIIREIVRPVMVTAWRIFLVFACIKVFCINSLSCSDPLGPCYSNRYPVITSYEVTPDNETPEGIPVDSNGQYVDLELIDQLVDELTECVEIDLRPDCLVVKIPPDWYVSQCTRSQLFPCDNDQQECLDKCDGDQDCIDQMILDFERCPCNCRARIQDENIIVTTPDMLLFKAELARMITHHNNPWPEYGACL